MVGSIRVEAIVRTFPLFARDYKAITSHTGLSVSDKTYCSVNTIRGRLASRSIKKKKAAILPFVVYRSRIHKLPACWEAMETMAPTMGRIEVRMMVSEMRTTRAGICATVAVGRGCRSGCRLLSAVFVVLLFAGMSSVLRAQGALQYCNAAYAGGELGCALSGGGCSALEAWYQACVADANSFPTPPPSPPSPPTPSSSGGGTEARPGRGFRSKSGVSPRDQPSSSVPCISARGSRK